VWLSIHKRDLVGPASICTIFGRPYGFSLAAVVFAILLAPVALHGGEAVIDANDNPAELVRQARVNYAEEKYGNAARDFARAILVLGQAHPDIPQLMYEQALSYFKAGDVKKAFNTAGKVIGFTYSDQLSKAKAHMLRGEVYLKIKKPKNAEIEFKKAIYANTRNSALIAQAWANCGMAKIRQNKPGSAVSDLKKALSEQPNYPYANAAIAVAYMKRGYLTKARIYAQKALEIDPDEQTIELASKVLDGTIKPLEKPDSVSINIDGQGHVFANMRFGKYGKPHRFLIDTGATHSVVRPELMPEIQKKTKVSFVGKGLVALADGSRRRVNRFLVDDVYLEKLRLGPIEVHVFQQGGGEIPNLLGIKSLKRVTISMNNTKGKAVITLNPR
jgi:tetratricopeptide (TPR) repeat protein